MSIELRKKNHLLTRLFGKASLLRAGMLGALVLCSLITFAQEAAEYKGTIKVHNKMYNEDDNIGKRGDIIYYGSFPTKERAATVRKGLEKLLNSGNSGMFDPDLEKKLKKYCDNNNLVSKVRGNGSFSKMALPGFVFLFFFNEETVQDKIIEIRVDNPNKAYTATFTVNRTREVISEGKARKQDEIGSEPAGDPDDGNEYFPIKFTLHGPGVANESSRIIVQTYAVDCQTEDTVAFLRPVVYEGPEYHELQDKRKGFDYFANDPLSCGYSSKLQLAYEGDVMVDTVVVFPKTEAHKTKTFKGPYTFIIEDYHHVKRREVAMGTCLRQRPFKFLNFNIATADIELNEEFKQAAEENFSKQDRKLNLLFKVGTAEMEADSLNQVTLHNMIRELKEWGDRLVNVSIEGAASPDGPTQKNMDLARQRASAALAMIKASVGKGSSSAPKVRVYEWTDVADILEKEGNRAQADELRSIVESNPGDAADPLVYRLSYYADTIAPVLRTLRAMKLSYMYQRQKILTPAECREFYYQNRAAGAEGRLKLSQLSDGDFYNLYTVITDSAEVDTITKIAYQKIIKGYDYQYVSKVAPYVANKMALLRLREGVPDASILDPFIDYSMRGVNAHKYIDDDTRPIVNRAEHLLNQAIIYFQKQKMDSCNYLIKKLKGAGNISADVMESVAKVEKFMNLKRLHYNRHRNAEEEADYQSAKEFVLGSSDENKAILYTEVEDWGMRDEAEKYVDQMDNRNPKKWYLKALLHVDKAGTEEDAVNYPDEQISVPVAELNGQKLLSEDEETDLMMSDPAAYNMYMRVKDTLETMQKEYNARYAEEMEKRQAGRMRFDSIPRYLAFFHHSFELQPDYKRFYFNEGLVNDDKREKYSYRRKDIPKYKVMFDLIMDEEASRREEELQKLAADAKEAAAATEQQAPAAAGEAAETPAATAPENESETKQ